MSTIARNIFKSICGRIGRGVAGSAVRSPWITDIQTGLSPGMTITGGPTYVADYLGTLRRTPAGYAAIEGGKYVTTLAEGAVLGGELITNGGLDSGANWTANTGWIISDGFAAFNHAVGNTLIQVGIITTGRVYQITYTVTTVSAGCFYARVGLGPTGTQRTTPGTYTETLASTGGDANFRIYTANNTVGAVDNVSVREIIPQWLPAPAEPSILVQTRKGLRTVYNDPGYLGSLIEPAATQYFKYPTAPATHTTVSMPVGTYTLWMEGSGSVTATAGTAVGAFGVATEAAPATITITTAGTTVLTVAGTVTFGQLENLPYKSSHIPDNTTTTFTRAAVVTSAPTAGVLPSSGQDFAIFMRVVPEVGGQNDKAILGTYLDGNNALSLRVYAANIQAYKRVSGVTSYITVSSAVHEKDVAMDMVFLQTSTGVASKYRKYVGVWGEWSAWTQVTTDVAKATAIIASAYHVGNNGAGSGQFAANYPITSVIQMPPKATLAEYQAWIEAELTLRGLI